MIAHFFFLMQFIHDFWKNPEKANNILLAIFVIIHTYFYNFSNFILLRSVK